MRYLPFYLVFIATVSNCLAQDEQASVNRFTRYLERLVRPEHVQPVVNIMIHMENQELGLSYSRGLGTVDRESNQAVSAEQPFKTASITKMFTAVVVLQLFEEGLIQLDDRVSDILRSHEYVKLDSLHLYGGVSHGRDITIRQLLNHSSGLADIFTDAESEFNAHVLKNPQKNWTPELLFEKYFEFELHKRAKFIPGTSYAYTDVGYFLLGLCIEEISGSPLAEEYRRRIITPLGLEHTFFEYWEVPSTNLNIAHAYIGEFDATKELNTSYDWAGGGLVSNVFDLTRFINALFELRLFRNESTLNKMIAGTRYGFGVSIFQWGERTYYGHLGFWGSGVFYDPEHKVTICISINQTNPHFNAMNLVKKARDFIEND